MTTPKNETKGDERDGLKAFDPSKPVQTRDSRPARIVVTDVKNVEGPLLGALLTLDGGDEAFRLYRSNGTFFGCGFDNLDLVNIPERHTVWLNCYADATCRGDVTAHASRSSADQSATIDRIACVKVEFEEGEGL